eukprot:scaffold265910_cov17-Tisochrysis_lutea.AAC.1
MDKAGTKARHTACQCMVQGCVPAPACTGRGWQDRRRASYHGSAQRTCQACIALDHSFFLLSASHGQRQALIAQAHTITSVSHACLAHEHRA